MGTSKEFSLPFIKRAWVAKDTFSFYFDRSKADYDFLPGQYNRVVLSHDNPDGRGTARFFTVASSPIDKEYLMITTKVIQSSFKKALYSLTPGTLVKFFGPMGNLVLRDEEKEPLVFLAGGIGITPFRSMLHYAAGKRLAFSIKLFASFSTIEDRIFYDELTKIAGEHSNIKVVYLSSGRSPAGHLQGGTFGKLAKYYVAGSPEMVEETSQLLESLRVPEEKIITESFIDY